MSNLPREDFHCLWAHALPAITLKTFLPQRTAPRSLIGGATTSVQPYRERLRAVGSNELLGRIWNCWTQNLISRDYGYITHAMELTESGHAPSHTLCGIRWTGETGMVNLRDDPQWQPGCKKCLKALVRRGILRPNE